MVTKLDRLGRSLAHLIELVRHPAGQGVDLVVLDQGVDTSTAVGRIFFHILGAIAEFEHALMSAEDVPNVVDFWRRPVDRQAAITVSLLPG